MTINDVVLAVLAGTLGAYHRERHVRVDSLNCMVPMNLRGKDERDQLGNRVGTFTVRLPLDERRARQRLQLVTAQTRAAKSDRRGAAAPVFLQAIGLLPGFAFRWIARQSLGRVNIACTNVPGIRQPRFMAGARVEAIYPFASVVEGTPMVMALLSYADGMYVGIDTDPEAIPEPQRLAELFYRGWMRWRRWRGQRCGSQAESGLVAGRRCQQRQREYEDAPRQGGGSLPSSGRAHQQAGIDTGREARLDGAVLAVVDVDGAGIAIDHSRRGCSRGDREDAGAGQISPAVEMIAEVVATPALPPKQGEESMPWMSVLIAAAEESCTIWKSVKATSMAVLGPAAAIGV